MKVLWFSNIPLAVERIKESGTWLFSMSRILVKNGIELYSITHGGGDSVEYLECNSIKEWRIPRTNKLKNNLPPKIITETIQKIVSGVQPDIIHVWGMEDYWGLLISRGIIRGKAVLDIQGIKAACADVYLGDLTNKEIIKSLGLKEILLPGRSVLYRRRKFREWGVLEHEMLSSFRNISIQSEWVFAHIKPYIKEETSIFRTKIMIRPEFTNALTWQIPPHKAPVISTIFSPHPFKGFYILLKALVIVKNQYPDVHLNVIGNFYNPASSYRRPGYISFLLGFIKNNNLEENISFVGPLEANGIVKEFLTANVMVQTSFCESYSMALAESMSVGIPCVVSYAGAMPELASDGKEALFYPPYDYFKCAESIIRVFQDKGLAKTLSLNSKKRALTRNNSIDVVNTQLSIYKRIIAKEKEC